jgi:hypothetical protein
MIEDALQKTKSEIVEEIRIDNDDDFIQTFYCSVGNIIMEVHLTGDLRRRKFWSDTMQSENQTTDFLKDYLMKLTEPVFSVYMTSFESFLSNAPSDGTCGWHSLACMEFSWSKSEFRLGDSWYKTWLTRIMGQMTVNEDNTSAYYRTSYLVNWLNDNKISHNFYPRQMDSNILWLSPQNLIEIGEQTKNVFSVLVPPMKQDRFGNRGELVKLVYDSALGKKRSSKFSWSELEDIARRGKFIALSSEHFYPVYVNLKDDIENTLQELMQVFLLKVFPK